MVLVPPTRGASTGNSHKYPPVFDPVILNYSSGTPAVMRQTDGSGFGYYPSGRKAVCINSHGRGSRRYSCILYDDSSAANPMGVFDEWGKGWAAANATGRIERSTSKLLVVDSNGQKKAHNLPSDATIRASLKLNDSLRVDYNDVRGNCDIILCGPGVEYVFGTGPGNENISVMPQYSGAEKIPLESTGQLTSAKSELNLLSQGIAKLTVSASCSRLHEDSNKVAKRPSAVLGNLLEGRIDFRNERDLHAKLLKANPRYTRATIKQWSGKYTDPLLRKELDTLDTVPFVTQERAIELSKTADDSLLVVLVFAAYAAGEQNSHGRLIGERVKSLLRIDGRDAAIQLIQTEGTQSSLFRRKFCIKMELPYVLMFRKGKVVYSKKLGGFKERLRPTHFPNARPRVLILEPFAADQLITEQAVRRCGLAFDLAISVNEAEGMIQRASPAYGIIMASTEMGADKLERLRSRALLHRQNILLFLLYRAGRPHNTIDGKDDSGPLERLARSHETCGYIFARPLRQSRLEFVLSCYAPFASPVFAYAGTSPADLLADINSVFGSARAS